MNPKITAEQLRRGAVVYVRQSTLAQVVEHRESRRRQYALLDHTIDVLSPEDLIVCKVAFARDKDARDISQILDSMGERLDVPYVLRWMETIVGKDAAAARQLTHALAQRSLLPDPRAGRDGPPAR